jgi:hypothetical protein
MADGLPSPSMPTLANGAAPAAPPADPGDIGPSVAPHPAPRPSAQENPRARGYSPAIEQREAAAARAASEPAPPAEPAPAADPQEPLPAGEKFKVGKFEVSEGELAAMLERQSLDDLRKATIPPTPQDYKLSLPENLKLPGDVQFKFDETGAKATFDAAKAWAHSRGLSQSDFSDMMGLYASHQAGVEAMLAERSRAEIAKVGINGPQRVDAVGKWITGMVGEADAKPIRATIVTDAHLRFYETIINKLTSQGSASFSQSHRVPPDTNGIPGYADMSFEQRRYAQDQIAMRRGGR